MQLPASIRQAVVGLLRSVFGISTYTTSSGQRALRLESFGATVFVLDIPATGIVLNASYKPVYIGDNNSYQLRLGGSGTDVLNLAADSTLAWTSANANVVSVDTMLSRAAARVIRLSGTATATGSATLCSIPVTPARITADQNNYAPTAGAMFYRLSTDAARAVTGLSISQVDGQFCEVWNVGSFNLTLTNESASSTAANRFTNVTGADIVLAPNEIARLRYDSTSARWRVSKG